jgi:serine/threonine-protein kinase
MEMAKLLDHPYIVTPLGGGERDGCLYMAMERFDGVNLRKRFSGRPAPVKGVILIARQIVSALAHAHDKKIVHRDIKPENILADRKGRTKILDFGIAKILEDDELCALTLARGILGTPGYMAPEQVDNPKRVDPRSDIYSLGCTLYFCLAGQSPHTGESPVEIIHSSRTSVPDIREARQETPPPLADLVTRCMAPDPGDRPQTASAVQFALENMEV